jgi:hypothetical protein
MSWNAVCSLCRNHENGCEKNAFPRNPAWSKGRAKLSGVSIKIVAAMVPLTRRCAIGTIPNELIVRWYGLRAEMGLVKRSAEAATLPH